MATKTVAIQALSDGSHPVLHAEIVRAMLPYAHPLNKTKAAVQCRRFLDDNMYLVGKSLSGYNRVVRVLGSGAPPMLIASNAERDRYWSAALLVVALSNSAVFERPGGESAALERNPDNLLLPAARFSGADAS